MAAHFDRNAPASLQPRRADSPQKRQLSARRKERARGLERQRAPALRS